MSRYLDLDRIAAEEERLPVEMTMPARFLGHLDVSTGTEHLSEGQRLELPLWMLSGLAESNLLIVDVPKSFGAKAREALQASTVGARLRDKSPYFYATGASLSSLCRHDPDAAALPVAVKATMAVRLRDILQKAQNSQDEDVSAYVNGLTDSEQELFWREYRTHIDGEAFRHQDLAELRPLAGPLAGAGAGGAGAAMYSSGSGQEAGAHPAMRRLIAERARAKRVRE